MEHAKKLMLVDPTNLDVRHVKRHYGLLDENISNVLDREDVDDYLKVRLYQNALNKFLANRQVIENDLNKPLKVAVETPKPTTSLDTYLTTLTDDQKTKFEQLVATAQEFEEGAVAAPEKKKKVRRGPTPSRQSNRKKKPAKKYFDWDLYN